MSSTGIYEIGAGSPDSPVILHVPHAATHIPHAVRQAIVLTDDELAYELTAMTDAHTDHLAAALSDAVHPRPWIFRNTVSRLALDPERFPDEREQMNAVGMGALYTRTSTGQPLRAEHAPQEKQDALSGMYWPYANALADLVDDRLAHLNQAVILDIHSYPAQPLPYELHPTAPRPPICLGTDPDHTPSHLIHAAEAAFEGTASNAAGPFDGTYVPLRHYRADLRVQSLMLETRRDTYLTPDGTPDPDLIATWVRRASALLAALPLPARV